MSCGGERPDESSLAALRLVAARHGDDLAQFRSEIALGVDADLWDPRADRVSLLTLHAAKGLEFPVVFIVGCEDGLLPLHWIERALVAFEEHRSMKKPAAPDRQRTLFES
jgi:superfamily I DNA/RNA helicase